MFKHASPEPVHTESRSAKLERKIRKEYDSLDPSKADSMDFNIVQVYVRMAINKELAHIFHSEKSDKNMTTVLELELLHQLTTQTESADAQVSGHTIHIVGRLEDLISKRGAAA